MNYSNTVAFIQPATGPSRVYEGSDMTLYCVIVLNPGNTVQDSVWRRNGILDIDKLPNHALIFNSTTNAFTDLVITNVSLDDDNVMYTCTATGGDVISSLKLEVTSTKY